MKKDNQSSLLTKDIMNYWVECAYRDSESDKLINNLIYDYAESIGIHQEKLNYDVALTVNNMTNSQKRKLFKIMQSSGIK